MKSVQALNEPRVDAFKKCGHGELEGDGDTREGQEVEVLPAILDAPDELWI